MRPSHSFEFEAVMSLTLSKPNLLGIRGMAKSDIDLIHATAREFKDVLNRPIKKVPSLRDLTVAICSSRIPPALVCHLNLPRSGSLRMW